MNNRQSIPKETQTMVLTKSKRRCALCYGLNNDTNEKTGQIAHLDKNRNNNNFNNLVWLCFDHHDKYDSSTSQSKNYTNEEVVIFRDKLYALNLSSTFSKDDIHRLRNFLNSYAELFGYIQNMGGELAYSICDEYLELIENLINGWSGNNLKSLNIEIKLYQDQIISIFNDIFNSYTPNDYHMANNNAFIFTWKDDQSHNQTLEYRKKRMYDMVYKILQLREKLENIAISESEFNYI